MCIFSIPLSNDGITEEQEDEDVAKVVTSATLNMIRRILDESSNT